MLVTPELSLRFVTAQPVWPRAPSIDPIRVPASAGRRHFKLWCHGSEFRPKVRPRFAQGSSERKLRAACLGDSRGMRPVRPGGEHLRGSLIYLISSHPMEPNNDDVTSCRGELG